MRDELKFSTNETIDALYKSHLANIDELILLYKLVHDMFVQLSEKHDII